MRILLTGATGFLGSHVAEALRGRGLAVRAIVRSTRQTQRLERMGVDLVRGSLDDVRSLRNSLDGVRAVVHCAGGGRATNAEDLFQQNAVTTSNLARAVRESRVDLARFVLVSSIAAHGPSRDGAPREPDAPCEPVSDYGRSKVAAEQTVQQLGQHCPVTIIRPPVIYGPRDDRMLSLFKAVRLGVIPIVSDSLNSLVYVTDCAEAIHRAATMDHPSGHAFFTDDGVPRTWKEIGTMVARSMGVMRTVPLRVPSFVLQALGAAGEALGRLRGRPSFFSRDKARDARERYWVCSSQTTRDVLGWKPEVDFATGLARTEGWYREAGWL